MKIRFTILLMSCAASLLLACAPKQNKTGQSGASSGPQIVTPGLARAQSLASEAQVSCAEGSYCPEGVAMVVAAHENGVDQCTGFLIAPDLLVTSHLCIPTDLRKAGVSCEGRVRAHFPADPRNALPASESECAELVGRTGESYVFIRLAAASNRRPLPVQVEGLAEAASVSVPVVSPVSDKRPIGEMRSLSCRVAQRSAVLPSFRSALAPIGALGLCPVSVAHSGAPVLDARGNALGIIKEGLAEPEAVQREYQSVLGPHQVVDFAFASNFACIKTPLDSSRRKLPADCTARPASPSAGVRQVISDEIMSAAQAKVDLLFAQWQKKIDSKLQWSNRPLEVALRTVALPFPNCFDSPEKWLGEYSPWYRFGGYDDSAQVEIQYSRFQATFSMNAFVQPTVDVTSLPPINAWVTFSPGRLANEGVSEVTVYTKNPNGSFGSVLVAKKTLGKCKK